MSAPILNVRGPRDGDIGMSAYPCPEVRQKVADGASKDTTSERAVHLCHNCLPHAVMYAVSFGMLQTKASFTVWDILLVVLDTHQVSAFEAFCIWCVCVWWGSKECLT